VGGGGRDDEVFDWTCVLRMTHSTAKVPHRTREQSDTDDAFQRSTIGF
jgi:hypothetical protein